MIEVKANIRQQVGVLLRSEGVSGSGRALVVTDDEVGPRYLDDVLGSMRAAGFAASSYTVAAGEASKRLEVAQGIYAFLAQERLGRDGVIVALGGGVVSDLAGFVAGTWMRGIRWAICPTTLEAQIDAAVGGKTAVNVPGAKNLVGVFHPPMLVAIDPACLATLPRRELIAGLAESVKHALITSEEFLRWHEENVERILGLESATIVALIERNVAIKTAIVDRDPRETTGERFVLNFGHTIGHAVEEYSMRSELGSTDDAAGTPTGTAHRAVAHELPDSRGSDEDELVAGGSDTQAACRRSPHPWPLSQGERGMGGAVAHASTAGLRHGECVAIGMVAACRLSQRLGMIDAALVERVEKLLLRFGLPTRIPAGMDVGQLLEVIRLDKKARGGKVQFVLLEGVGRPIVRGDVGEEQLSVISCQ